MRLLKYFICAALIVCCTNANAQRTKTKSTKSAQTVKSSGFTDLQKRLNAAAAGSEIRLQTKLNIPDNQTLTIPKGVTLITGTQKSTQGKNSTIIVYGKMINKTPIKCADETALIYKCWPDNPMESGYYNMNGKIALPLKTATVTYNTIPSDGVDRVLLNYSAPDYIKETYIINGVLVKYHVTGEDANTLHELPIQYAPNQVDLTASLAREFIVNQVKAIDRIEIYQVDKTNDNNGKNTISKKAISIPVTWKRSKGGSISAKNNMKGMITHDKTIQQNETITFTDLKSGTYFISFKQKAGKGIVDCSEEAYEIISEGNSTLSLDMGVKVNSSSFKANLISAKKGSGKQGYTMKISASSVDIPFARDKE